MSKKKTKKLFEVDVLPHFDLGLSQQVEATNEKEAIRIVRKGAREELQKQLLELARYKTSRICTATFSVSPVSGDDELKEYVRDEVVEEEWNV